MLGFQHADLNFQPEFHQHDDVHPQHHELVAVPTNMSGGWPSCAQQQQTQIGLNAATTSVTSTTGSKKSDKSGKKSAAEAVNNATKKKKTRFEINII